MAKGKKKRRPQGHPARKPTPPARAAQSTEAQPWVNPDGVSPVVGSVGGNHGDDSVWFSTNTGIWRVPEEGGEPAQVTGRGGPPFAGCG